MKNGVQPFYRYDAEVVKVASSLLPVVSLHPLDLLPSAQTFFVFVGAHENDLSYPWFRCWLLVTVVNFVGPTVAEF